MLLSIAKEMRSLESSIRATHVQRVAIKKQQEAEELDKDAGKAEQDKDQAAKKEEFVDEFGQGDNNIHVDELSDDEVAASRNDGQKQRGFEKSKLIRINHCLDALP